MIREGSLHFNCSGLVNMQPKKLLQYLSQSLIEMRQLMENQLNLSKDTIEVKPAVINSTEKVDFLEHIPSAIIQHPVPFAGEVAAC
ncbi:hypothetical protein K7432_014459 [Basidiobolus ranarum]|uniref:Uncharacterized protein n=1 Tax=Basidiobolus ranarum TaxID=34480 RepID=A0ABR2VPF6_9FUNG